MIVHKIKRFRQWRELWSEDDEEYFYDELRAIKIGRVLIPYLIRLGVRGMPVEYVEVVDNDT